MMKRIPKELENFYSRVNRAAKIYIKMRWRCCPFEEIEKKVPLTGIIVDLGCGYGLLANFLAMKSKERQVTGIDLSRKRINIAELTVGDRRNIKFAISDIRDVDLGSCDGVVMSDFLHHIPPIAAEDILMLVYKKLVPDGKLVIQEVDKFPRWKYYSAFLIDILLNIGESPHYKSSQEWKKILENIGFQVKIIPVHRNLFLSDVLLICSNNENPPNNKKT